ncbi:hypothetical protein L1887_35793 [Cichorium endivia]|nr:hypothetical protein L1887_35793 [Cichorium endivia]
MEYQKIVSKVLIGFLQDALYPGTLCMWADCTMCFESCASAIGECGCLGGCRYRLVIPAIENYDEMIAVLFNNYVIALIGLTVNELLTKTFSVQFSKQEELYLKERIKTQESEGATKNEEDDVDQCGRLWNGLESEKMESEVGFYGLGDGDDS